MKNKRRIIEKNKWGTKTNVKQIEKEYKKNGGRNTE